MWQLTYRMLYMLFKTCTLLYHNHQDLTVNQDFARLTSIVGTKVYVQANKEFLNVNATKVTWEHIAISRATSFKGSK